jgi:hypothetical protein
MVLLRVNSVDTDGVGLELLQLGDVALACRRVGKRVGDVNVVG